MSEDTCVITNFVEEPAGLKIIAPNGLCCDDVGATALVYYNGLYCHPASASFSALPTGLPPCSEIPVTPPTAEPPVTTGSGGGSIDDGGGSIGNPDDPPISDPPPVTPPIDEPPPVVPPDDGGVDTGGDGTDDPAPDPDPVVDPPPPVPPPVVTFRFARPLSSVVSFGKEPFSDFMGASSGDFPEKLAAARSRHMRCMIRLFKGYPSQQTILGDPELNPASPLFDPTMVVNGFNLRRAKAQISNAHALMPDLRSYVDDGTALSNYMIDDFGTGASTTIWNGRGPTAAEIDALAAHSKSVTGWSTLPCSARGDASYLNSISPVGGWKHLDIAHVQIAPSTWNSGLGTSGWMNNQYNKAKTCKLGFMSGGNLLNGGSGRAWSISPSDPAKFGMSPQDLGELGDWIVTMGNFKMLGCSIWTEALRTSNTRYIDYYNRTDIQAALTTLKNKVKDLKIGPVNFR